MTTPAPDTDRTDAQGDGLRKALVLWFNTVPYRFAPEFRTGAYLADALLRMGPLAQLRSDLRAAEAERDHLREEWAQEGIGWLRDRDIERLMSVEDNLIALAKMYGEACGILAKVRKERHAVDRRIRMQRFALREDNKYTDKGIGSRAYVHLWQYAQKLSQRWRTCLARAEAAEAERDLLRTRVGGSEKDLKSSGVVGLRDFGRAG